jgi:XTP/dITP diphosphohydrolase
VTRALVIATRNRHKLEEIRAVLADLPAELQCGLDHPGCPEVDEDGDTLEANAAKKAAAVCAHVRLPALADDTGLEVEALGGAPGVFSARWAGPGCTFAANNDKLLRALAGQPAERRRARFRCVVALAWPEPGRPVQLFQGELHGRIATAPRGGGGFGYDPLFEVEGLGRTLAEFSPAEKNSISHRALALAGARRALLLEWTARA